MSDDSGSPAFIFDLDGTLVDSVYQHVLAWREALERGGMELSVWSIHRRIGMSGGLLINALLRETHREITPAEAEQLQRFHAEAYKKLIGQVRPLPGAKELLGFLKRPVFLMRLPPAGGLKALARLLKFWGSIRRCR